MNGKSLLFSLILISPLAIELRGAPVDSRITAVTVYTDRAIVTRTASVSLTAGEQSLVFENLPNALTDQSLQASGRGVAGATILDVSAETVFTEAAPNDRVKALEEQIKALLKQRRVLDDRSKILEEQRSFVQRMLQASTGSVATGARGAAAAPVELNRPTLEEWQRLYGYSEETFGKIAAELQSLDTQKEDLQARQGALERQLNEVRGARGKQSKTITVRLAATTTGRLDLSVRYSIPNAGWSPSYDARLRSADRAVELSYFGTVRNGTGEDWKDVALTLSTARPNLGGGAPELQAWIADVARPMPAATSASARNERGGGAGAGGAASQSFQNFNAAPGGAPGFGRQMLAGEADAGSLAASVEAGVTSATFKIPVTVTVPGNNVSQKVAINAGKLAATLQFQSTPKVLEAAFLSAYANNASDYPLLAGPMNTFLDDTFVAASRLKTVMPGEKFELALGADDGISIKRRLVNRFSEDTGITSKTRKITYQYLITITNNKTTTEHIVFKEPTPVSRDEKIVVKIATPSDKDIGTPANMKEVTREEDGKLVWRIDMKPAEKREFSLKFSIEHPVDMAVSGVD